MKVRKEGWKEGDGQKSETKKDERRYGERERRGSSRRPRD